MSRGAAPRRGPGAHAVHRARQTRYNVRMKRQIVACLVLAIASASVGGCRRRGRFHPSWVGVSAIEVRRAGAVVRDGIIGAGRYKGEGTYVLVDAVNRLSVDVDVALDGELLDEAGAALAVLDRDSLRIPAHAQRTFALVHHTGRVAGAARARIRVSGTRLSRHRLPVHMRDTHVYQDGDRVVVAANVTNEVDRELIVVVIAGFYGADGAIVERPFSVIRIPPSMTKPARFVGPAGSVRGYLFTGDLIY